MFSAGDKIAHPMHGAGIIEGIEEKKINGKVRKYYVLRLTAGGMTVLIPLESCEAVGIRPIVSAEEAENIMNSVSEIEYDMTQNWNQRYRENMLRIKSGDLLEVAKVIKGLIEREKEKSLSTGERKMLRLAKQILISELVLSEDKSYEEIEARINEALA